MTVLGKRGVMGNLLIETESSKPAPGQMHLQFLDQLALAGDAIEIADQQNAQEEFWIDRGSARIAVGVLQLLTNEIEADVPVKETEEVVFRNLIFNAKVVEQRLGTGVLSHHNPQASVNGDEEEHRQNACSYRRCCQQFSSHSRRLFQHPPDLSTSLTKSAWSRVFSSGFISFAHTPAAAQSRLFLGECCAAILEFLSLSNLRARSVSLHPLGLSTRHLSDHLRP